MSSQNVNIVEEIEEVKPKQEGGFIQNFIVTPFKKVQTALGFGESDADKYENDYPSDFLSDDEFEDEKTDLSQTSSRKKYTRDEFERELQEAKLVSGLLHNPDEYLNISTKLYYERKKLLNLTDIEGQTKLLSEALQKVKLKANLIYQGTLEQIGNANPTLLREKIVKIAEQTMKAFIDQEVEILKVQFPYLRI